MKIRRSLRWALYFLLLLFFAAISGMLWLVAVPSLLALGWLGFLLRAIPEVSVAPGQLAFALVCLAAFGFGAHYFLRWLFRAWQDSGTSAESAPAWQPRWTGAGVALLVLLFTANIATVGVIHQLGWMARGPMVKNSWGGPLFRTRRLCSNIRYTRRSPDELRAAIWRDPELRMNARDLHVLVRERDDGGAIAAIFPRGPIERERVGIHLCGHEINEAYKSANASRILREYGFAEAAQRLAL